MDNAPETTPHTAPETTSDIAPHTLTDSVLGAPTDACLSEDSCSDAIVPPHAFRQALAGIIAVLIVLLIVTSITGCQSRGSTMRIVATTSSYSSIAKSIAGEYGMVRAILTDPAIDPTSYRPTEEDAALLRHADLVIVNGNNYDDFAAKILEHKPADRIISAYSFLQGSTDVTDVPPVTTQPLTTPRPSTGITDNEEAVSSAAQSAAQASAQSLASHAPEPGQPNTAATDQSSPLPHQPPAGPSLEGILTSDEAEAQARTPYPYVVYNLDVMEDVAEAITSYLCENDPAHEASYRKNRRALIDKMEHLRSLLDTIAQDAPRTTYMRGKPLATPLAMSAEMRDLTPAVYAESLQDPATEVPRAYVDIALHAIEELHPQVVFCTAETPHAHPSERLLCEKAQEENIPVVTFTESLPKGMDYITWMTQNVQALHDAIMTQTKTEKPDADEQTR